MRADEVIQRMEGTMTEKPPKGVPMLSWRRAPWDTLAVIGVILAAFGWLRADIGTLREEMSGMKTKVHEVEMELVRAKSEVEWVRFKFNLYVNRTTEGMKWFTGEAYDVLRGREQGTD